MNPIQKTKKKAKKLSKVTSEQLLSKSLSTKKNSLLTSRSELINSKASSKKISKLDGYKSINSINLQIPSLLSANSLSSSSNLKNSSGKKKSAMIKGYASKLNPHKNNKTKGEIKKESEKDQKSGENTEDATVEAELLNKELKKELEKNRVLKEKLNQEVGKDYSFDELMTSFKARLYKLLYN